MNNLPELFSGPWKPFAFGLLTFIIALILLTPATSFCLSLGEILEKSKEDPDFAWDMYLSYISQLSPYVSNEESRRIEQLGRILNAKRKLKDFDFALKEDVDGLIKFLKTSTLKPNLKYYILEIFGEEKLIDYLNSNLSRNIDALLILNVLTIDVKDYAKDVLEIISKDTKTKEKLFSEVLKNLEKRNAFVQYVLEELYQRYADADKEMKARILELYKDFKAHGFVDERFERILAKKNKLWFVIWSSVKEFFSHLLNVGKNLLFSTVFLVVLVVIVLFSIRYTRYEIFYLLGLKKLAAQTYRKIVDKDPLNEEKRLRLAQLYEEAGMFEEAMNEYNFLKRIKLE
ncbi:hypothetical protein SAMN04488510_12924 [Fervidobacterium changbaicum]|uniref:Tetratricopeptide repeat protein n=2 Tax=Fervidobacterium TaxID=2422 RepID=A0AAI8CKK6_FERIS|nr:tetratricopeptide repeat protein [Fervidobacterium islandicum]AMW32117.2 tetratricopeptide repeat protein [Fervidobacterium islandicum]SDH73478.1 hypothetical protein SAMN04488510_12924 [Fervidobacterium changbaicum]